MRKYFYLCGVIFLSMNLFAQQRVPNTGEESQYCSWKKNKLTVEYNQIVLSNTIGWRYDQIYSDEFEGNHINTSKWNIPNNTWHSPNSAVGFINSPNNVRTENGKLRLSVTANEDSLLCYCSWDTVSQYIVPKLLAGRVSSTQLIRYGYFETLCYLPKNHNYWPCFWTYHRDAFNEDYDEVDIFERTRSDSTDKPNIIRQNCYNNIGYPDQSQITQILTFPDSITGKTIVFGAEILPEEVVFYINGHVSSHLKYHPSPIQDSLNPLYTCTDIEEMIEMHALLTLTCDPTQTSIPLPQESALFEYFRCYKLERGDVNTYHPTVFIPSDESTKVYPHVIIGGSGCTAVVNTSTAVWAEQDILLDKGFEVPVGTTFSARVISVPNPESSPLYIQNCHNSNEN